MNSTVDSLSKRSIDRSASDTLDKTCGDGSRINAPDRHRDRHLTGQRASVNSERNLVERIDSQTFLDQWDNYVGKNRPVVLTAPEIVGGDAWDEACLLNLIGDEIVQALKSSTGIYTEEVIPAPMPLSVYLATLRREAYRYNLACGVEAYPALAQRLRMPDTFRARIGKKLISTKIWIGGKNYLTALHYDPLENLNLQLYGRKRFWLFPPNVKEIKPLPLTSLAGHMACVRSANDLPEPARARVRARGIEVILEPGEMLYLPVRWWHQVEAIDDLNVNLNYFWFPRTILKHPREVLSAMMTSAYRFVKGRPIG